jgi:hypothetical protein
LSHTTSSQADHDSPGAHASPAANCHGYASEDCLSWVCFQTCMERHYCRTGGYLSCTRSSSSCIYCVFYRRVEVGLIAGQRTASTHTYRTEWPLMVNGRHIAMRPSHAAQQAGLSEPVPHVRMVQYNLPNTCRTRCARVRGCRTGIAWLEERRGCGGGGGATAFNRATRRSQQAPSPSQGQLTVDSCQLRPERRTPELRRAGWVTASGYRIQLIHYAWLVWVGVP